MVEFSICLCDIVRIFRRCGRDVVRVLLGDVVRVLLGGVCGRGEVGVCGFV